MRVTGRFALVGTAALAISVITTSGYAIAAPSAPVVRTAVSPSIAGEGGFVQTPQTRIFDSRTLMQPLQSGAVQRLDLASAIGVPAAALVAALVHVTVISRDRSGYLSLYADGSPVPGTSTLNYVGPQTVSNSAVAQVSASGAVDLRVSTGPVDVVVDVDGWYQKQGGSLAGAFVPVAPVRLVDTRTSGTPVSSVERTAAATSAGVPADASGLVLNVTAVNATRTVPLTVWPTGSARPLASSLNAAKGLTVASLVMVGVGAGGSVSFAAASIGTTDVLVDLVGYFSATGAAGPGPGGFEAVMPYRVLDTRVTGGPVSTRARSQQVGTDATRAPARAVVVTITAFAPTQAGAWLAAWKDGDSRPVTSLVNARTDIPVAELAVLPVGLDGTIDVASSLGTLGVIVDVVGFIVDDPLPAVAPAVVARTQPATAVAGEAAAADVLTTANRYALQTWWPQTAPGLLVAPMTSTSFGPDDVRRVSMEALSLAIALRTGAYDPSATGVSAAGATQVVAEIVSVVAAHHRANVVGGWGSSWQSPLFASLAGRAGWLVWDDLDSTTQTEVERMVLGESDYVDRLAPKYLVLADGTVRSPGDTGAEEDSWEALAPALATAMMPTAPAWSTWREQEEQMLVAAWAEPGDVSASTLVDGRALSSWLGGSNILADGTVLNHQRIAPDYATNIYQSIEAAQTAMLAGQHPPQATVQGIGAVYQALSTTSYLAPPMLAPGGTVYTAGSPSVYYPQGCDWGTGQMIPFALMDADVAVFAPGGAGQSVQAAAAMAQHLAASAELQERTPSGAMYVNSSEYNYVGREEQAAQLAAEVYLTLFLQGNASAAVQSSPQRPPLHPGAQPIVSASERSLHVAGH